MSIEPTSVVVTYANSKNVASYAKETLYTAAQNPDPDQSLRITEHLLRLNADPNAPYSMYGDTPLQWAAENKCPQVVQALLQAGADPKATDLDGTTALHYARDAASTELLLRCGADPQATNSHLSTPFISAIRRGFTQLESIRGFGNFNVAKRLVSAGTIVEFEEKDLFRCSLFGARQLMRQDDRRPSCMTPAQLSRA